MAEAKYKNLQSGLLIDQANARQGLAGALKDPNYAADPANRAQIFSWMARLPPEEQKTWHDNLAPVMTNTNMPGQDVDTFVGRSGMVPYQNTPSGVAAGLANQTGIARIQAGATTGAATISAGGQIGSEQIRSQTQQDIDDRTQVIVRTPQGDRITTKGDMRTSGQGYSPTYQDPATGMVVYQTDEQRGVTPKTPPASHGQPPPPTATQPQPSTTPPPQSGAQQPPYGQTLAGNVTKGASTNLSQADLNTALAQLKMSQTGKTLLGTPYELGPGMLAAVTARANQYYRNRANQATYQQPGSAVTQAWNDVVTPFINDSSKIKFANNPVSREPPVVDYAPGFAPPPSTDQTPLPSTSRPTTAPAATPLPSSGTSAIPAPAPAKPPAVRRQAAPAPAAAPVAKSFADIPAQKQVPGLVVQGRMYTGGDISNQNSWRPAQPAETKAAQQKGMFYQ
jgi:hypothetical protein